MAPACPATQPTYRWNAGGSRSQDEANDWVEVTSMLSRRTALLTTLAAALPAGRSLAANTAAATATPVTVLQVQRRSIEVNGKAASVLGIRQTNGTAGLV